MKRTNADRPITSYREWSSTQSTKFKLRSLARNALLCALSLTSRVPSGSSWIRFPYYHHVFDDERKGFTSQLRYMQNLGELVSLDQALELLESGDPLDGRYLCLTFDDGFKNCVTNAVPILLDAGATAAFFVATRYIQTSPARDRELILGFYPHGGTLIEFMDWDDCRALVRAGMTVGSHTVSHRQLIELGAEEAEREMRDSREVIERELGVPCNHFCAPVGRPGIDFDPERDPAIARRLGYRSFLTTRRGSWQRRPEPMLLDRDHQLAGVRLHQLRYFLAR